MHDEMEDDVLNAWAEEAARRYEEIASGKVKGIPADEVFARARNRHARPLADATSTPDSSPGDHMIGAARRSPSHR
jgi:hypothetical protein